MDSKRSQFEVERIGAVTIIKTEAGMTVGAGTTEQACMALAEFLAAEGKSNA